MNTSQLSRTVTLAALLISSGVAVQAQVSTNATTNSTVRFRISHGFTLLGDVDVQLFDQLKPVTVSNFLAYAQAGRYADSILHRLAPSVVVEGGGYTIPTPYADSPLVVATPIPEDPPITNEFNAGGVQNNTVGTLAMAKIPGQPHSATSRWFFNLGDNTRGSGPTNLNTANGGYTVFGRVTAGLSILTQLNNRQLGNGIIDTTSTRYRAVCQGLLPFTALPVSFFGGLGCVNYTDVYTVEIILLNAPDVLRPTIAIVAPKANAQITSPEVTARGWVTDNVGILSVRVRHGTNDPILAALTGTNWTAVVSNLPPGTNSIVAEAIDTSGLRGQAVVTLFRSVRTPFTLTTVGSGTVAGASDQQLLEIGRGYQLTARPAPGNLFAGWEGDATGDNSVLHFLMASNRTITAVFATNQFPQVQGSYVGLFYNPDAVEPASSGYVSLNLTKAGAYSGKLQMHGRTYPMKGIFSPDGHETNLVARPGTNSLLLTLAVDFESGSDQLTGSLTNNQVTALDTNAGWSASVSADRATFKPPLNPAPQAGRYTLLVPPDETSPAGPPADGYGSAQVQPQGKISFAGALPDGTRLAQSTTISKDGSWPLYVSVGRDATIVLGWLSVTNAGETNLSGRLNWFKPSRAKERYYRGGFTNETVVVGSVFVPGNATNRVFGPTNGVVGFTNGNLAADFAHSVEIDAKGKVQDPDSSALKFSIAKSTGLFSGSVKPPGSNKSIALKGAILQRQNRGAGYFLGTNAAGRVLLSSEP